MRFKFIASFLFLFFQAAFVLAQPVNRPKLVVGIVVDQMRWDFLYRYNDRYGSGGFKRLLKEGNSCENTMIPYSPAHTGAGHASIYSGSVPAINGILGNNWYDRQLKRVVYCTEDNTVRTVGSSSSAGNMSPKNMWSHSITDELRLATNFRSRTIALALKDRGSILPGGHSANAAYWFDNQTGGWISSSYYMDELPAWLRNFNEKKLPDQYLKEGWNTLFPVDTYVSSTTDSNGFESKLPGEDISFPHITKDISRNRFETFRYMPAANTYTFELAKTAIVEEKLGREETDFLAISFSATDYIGHAFGPNSIEMEDTYLRFDRDLEAFLQFLDKRVGKGQYLVFLTADHGAAHNPGFLQQNKLPGDTYDHQAFRRELHDTLEKMFGKKKIIEHWINYQAYFNDSLLIAENIDRQLLVNTIRSIVLKQPWSAALIDLKQLPQTVLPGEMKELFTNGYNQKLSGDVLVVFKPQWFEGWKLGTTHGQWNPYDTHIPLIWYGWGIKKGYTYRTVYMTDIAPTLATLLKIQMPNGSVGKVIGEVVK